MLKKYIVRLTAEAATQGLSPEDHAELSALLRSDPALRKEAESYELAVAAIELALVKHDQVEPLPSSLRDRLIASSDACDTKSSAPLKLSAAPVQPVQGQRWSWTDSRALGWYAAMAAMIALVFVIVVENKQPTAQPAPTLAQQCESLLGQVDTLTAKWKFNAEAGDARFAGTEGQVIWNTTRQQGYMKLTGLPINEPTKEQYQLWIVDPSRDAVRPVDGGVFDITAAGEVIVPIDAKLRSDKPVLFAITVEKPGGVVVSQGPLHVVATVEKAG